MTAPSLATWQQQTLPVTILSERLTFAPSLFLFGTYPLIEKPTAIDVAMMPADLASYLQGALNLWLPKGAQLKVDGKPGPLTQRALRKFQTGRQLQWGVLADTWEALDLLAFSQYHPAGPGPRIPRPRGLAIDPQGLNRHTGQPVDRQGLTWEACRLQWIINARGLATGRNVAVDRLTISGTPSQHREGQALDYMMTHPGGVLQGHQLLQWVADHCAGPVRTGLAGRTYAGPYRISYALFDGMTYYPSNGNIRPMKLMQAVAAGQISPQDPRLHRTHVHISVVPIDRKGQLS